MNVEEPDKFERFTAWVQETAAAGGAGIEWLNHNAETVAVSSAIVVGVLVVLLVVSVRRRRRNPKVSGWRHARR